MCISLMWRALFWLLLLTPAQPMSAQLLSNPESGSRAAESAPVDEIRSVLRAFYFSLAHEDWDGLSRHILPAKVIARWAQPGALRGADAAQTEGPRANSPEVEPGCTTEQASAVAHAAVAVEGRWGVVRMPPCSKDFRSRDEFRLFFMQGSWRIVHIALAER